MSIFIKRTTHEGDPDGGRRITTEILLKRPWPWREPIILFRIPQKETTNRTQHHS